jgi:hypothetical protein
MKFLCDCGHQISDGTDFLSYKGAYIGDQDIEDMLSAIVQKPESAWETFHYYSRIIYQCEKCQRLYFPQVKGSGWSTFIPEQSAEAKQILSSIEGEKWKRQVRGRWREGKGELWWGFGTQDQGFETKFATWEELHSKYMEVFQRLKDNNILRDAFLKKESEIFHEWPPSSSSTLNRP